MIICKNLNPNNKIESLKEWFSKCQPQGKERHWKEDRSAMETARHWLKGLPQPFIEILNKHAFKYQLCAPEYVTRFDNHRGNGRNHDLLIVAEDKNQHKIIISVESKVDEPFGKPLVTAVLNAKAAVAKNPKSKRLERIQDLISVLFGKPNENQLELPYQLLTAVAGTIAEAKKQGAETAIFLVQTFVTNGTLNKKQMQNLSDLNKFLEVFSKGKKGGLGKVLVGPFRIHENNDYLSNEIDLWIGKYDIEL